MATMLRFDVAEVEALARHARVGPAWDMGYDCDVEQVPGLFLVKDEGVYLQSNSRTPNPGGHKGRQKVAYAKGYNPFSGDKGWNQKGQALSGDDFADLIPLFVFEEALAKRSLLSRVMGGEREIRLVVSEHGYGVALRSPEAN
jgi:hypothetical protein